MKIPLGGPNCVPFLEERPVLVEDLDPTVPPVANEHPPSGVHGDGVQTGELPRSRPRRAPGCEEGPVLRELHDASIVAVTIGDEDVAVGNHHDIRRSVEGIRTQPGNSRLTKGHQKLAIRTEFEDLMSPSAFALRVSCPHEPLMVDMKPVRPHEHSHAPRLDKVA